MTWRCQQGCVPSANRKKRGLEEDTAGPYIIKRGPIKIVRGKSQNENGGDSLSCTKLNRTKKKGFVYGQEYGNVLHVTK